MIYARTYRPEDEPQLQELAAAPMPGWVRLSYRYVNGYAAGEGLKGGETEIFVVEEPKRGVLGCGTRSVRLVWLDGQPTRVAYLSGLRSFPSWRGGYGFFRGLAALQRRMSEDPVSVTFTTILSGNPRARMLLTSGRAGLPRYMPYGRVLTFMLAGRASSQARSADVATAETLRTFYEREAPRRQLFPVFGARMHPSLSPSDFFVFKRGGEVVGAAAVWNHGNFRRIAVDGYGRAGFLRGAANLWARATGRPPLPPPGAELACSYLAYALVKGDDPQLFAELVREASARTCGRALVFSLHDGDPLVDTARHMAAWRYESEFMIVTYGADPNGFTGVPYIEAGAL